MLKYLRPEATRGGGERSGELDSQTRGRRWKCVPKYCRAPKFTSLYPNLDVYFLGKNHKFQMNSLKKTPLSTFYNRSSKFNPIPLSPVPKIPFREEMETERANKSRSCHRLVLVAPLTCKVHVTALHMQNNF
jgi:hypothetical protein